MGVRTKFCGYVGGILYQAVQLCQHLTPTLSDRDTSGGYKG
jgi:hypothetical protein